MSVKYLRFNVSIHGVDVKDDVVIGYLQGWIKTAVEGAMRGNMNKYFNFRNYENDIEVELDEQAGEFEVLNKE